VKGILIAGTPESWKVKSEANASGGGGIIADGTNSTGDSPHSFAQFQLQFATAGTYYLYYRWRADETRTAGDVFTANSSWIATAFGALSTPGAAAQADYYRSRSNDGTAPSDNAYAWVRETDATVYAVSAAQLGVVQVLTVGTREAGMIFDRFVLSTEPALSDAQLEALVNSGTKAPSPELASAVGSPSLNTVTVKFTRPLSAATVVPANFSLTPAVSIASVTLDAGDARVVTLATAAQSEGTRYTLKVSGVRDASGTAIQPESSIAFTAWKRVNGWVTKEIYFGVAGDNLQALLDDPKFQSGKADRVEYVRGFQLNQDPQSDNYGARLSAFFSPSQSGAYDFFVNNDNEAELRLSTDASEANLSSLGVFATSPRVFDEAILGTSSSLAAGQRYLLVGLLKQGGGDVYLNVAARPNGSATPPAAELPVLGGERVSTYVNPDLGVVEFATQPANVTSGIGGRARLAIKVNARTSPVYYQWQADGVDIPGAVRAAYITPALSASDHGRKYRCVVSVAGVDTPSAEGTLTVGASEPSPWQPYVGINFFGGGGGSVGGGLGATEAAGAIPQENWNNLNGFTFDGVALHDATGGSSPVTLSVSANTETWYSGTRTTEDADGVLLQGFLSAGASRDPVMYTLGGIPSGTYDVLVYSVGFDFSSDYRQVYSVAGEGSYPTYYGKSQTGLTYTQSPGYQRMDSTSPGTRPSGNYVQFNNVKPASDGTVSVSVAWDAPTEVEGNGHQPTVNAIQLVRVVPVTAVPRLTAARSASGLTLSWGVAAAGFVLETRAALGVGGGWTPVAGAGTLSGAGTFEVPATTGAAFYRLRK
jgi:hypothetical protein